MSASVKVTLSIAVSRDSGGRARKFACYVAE